MIIGEQVSRVGFRIIKLDACNVREKKRVGASASCVCMEKNKESQGLYLLRRTCYFGISVAYAETMNSYPVRVEVI